MHGAVSSRLVSFEHQRRWNKHHSAPPAPPSVFNMIYSDIIAFWLALVYKGGFQKTFFYNFLKSHTIFIYVTNYHTPWLWHVKCILIITSRITKLAYEYTTGRVGALLITSFLGAFGKVKKVFHQSVIHDLVHFLLRLGCNIYRMVARAFHALLQQRLWINDLLLKHLTSSVLQIRGK